MKNCRVMLNFVAMNMELTEIFSIDICLWAWVALATGLLCGVLCCVLLWRRLGSVVEQVRHDDNEPIAETGYPSVSVIVYCQGSSENLRRLLPEIFEQDYPSEMEVIVVNDEKSVATEDVVSLLERKYHNLYMTFAPNQTHALSRKKLSITLGLKAARNEYVVLTSGNCRIESKIWLKLMMRHTIEGKEVVLGRSRLSTVDDEGVITAAKLGRMARFDREWSLIRWLGSAIKGRAFMGDGNNLVYRRELFFANKGFSKTLNLKYGDDDVFVSEISTKENTAVELSPDACVMDVDTMPEYINGVMKLRRMFTSKYLPRRAYRYMGFVSLLNWLMLLFCVAGAVMSLPSLAGSVTAIVILLGVWIPLMFRWRSCGRSLEQYRPLCFTAPFVMLMRSVYNLVYRYKARKERGKNYTYYLSREKR